MSGITKKIQKLLSLAESSNEHEAKAAANMAQELMVKHNLQSVDLEESEYGENVIDEYKRANVQSKYVIDLLDRFFFVKPVTARRARRNEKTLRIERYTTLEIFGTKENVEIAQYTYGFLMRAFDRSWKEYKRETGAPASSKQSYMVGLWRGLKEQLSTTRKKVENETGLVVVQDHGLSSYMFSKIGATKQRNSRTKVGDSQAANSGKEAGRNMRISRGINQGHAGKVLAIG